MQQVAEGQAERDLTGHRHGLAVDLRRVQTPIRLVALLDDAFQHFRAGGQGMTPVRVAEWHPGVAHQRLGRVGHDAHRGKRRLLHLVKMVEHMSYVPLRLVTLALPVSAAGYPEPVVRSSFLIMCSNPFGLVKAYSRSESICLPIISNTRGKYSDRNQILRQAGTRSRCRSLAGILYCCFMRNGHGLAARMSYVQGA